MTEKTYKIGEVAEILNLKSYVLRFWETEFPQVAPLRTEKGQRLYTENDVAVLKRIKTLLHEQGMTIDGARRILSADVKHSPDPLSFSHSPQHTSLPEAPVPARPAPQAQASGVQLVNTRLLKEELLAMRRLLTGQTNNKAD